MNKINNKKGFTLVELLVVLVILAILAAAVIPSMFGFIDESKKKLCEVNRLMIIRGWNYQQVLNPSMTLQAYFDSDDGYKDGAVCPSGGNYTVSGNTVTCDIHGSSTGTAGANPDGSEPGGEIPGEGESGGKYPGTNATISSNYWPVGDDFKDQPDWYSLDANPGGLFKYTDDGYYAVFQYVNNIKKSTCGSIASKNNEFSYGIVKATGTVINQGENWTDSTGAKRYKVIIDGRTVLLDRDNPVIPGVKAGDMITGLDGVTWICIREGYTCVPESNTNGWYQLP